MDKVCIYSLHSCIDLHHVHVFKPEKLVVASFTIDSKGKVTDIQIVRGIHEELDNAVVKALEKSPAWTPGEVDGKTVPVKFTLPVVFKMQ